MSEENRAWHQRWDEGRIGFHRDSVHSDLIDYADRFLGDQPRRVFLPLCGKTLDLAWLAERGHEAIGVELVDRAVAALHEEQGLDAEVSQQGPFRVYRSAGVTVYCGDFFELTPELLGPVDCIWDRAALIALPAPTRVRYVRHLRALAGERWTLLQNTLEYDQSIMQGPPWSVPDDEVRRHYGDLDVELLHRRDVLDDRRREQGHDYLIGSTYLIERR